MSNELETKMKELAENGKLPCASAFQIARELNVSIREVGDTANKLNIRICKCQLGLFP